MDVQYFLPIIVILLPVAIVLYFLLGILWVQNILIRPVTKKGTLKGVFIKIGLFCILEILIYTVCYHFNLFFILNMDDKKVELLSLVFAVLAVFAIIISIYQATQTKINNKVTYYDITYDQRPGKILILGDITESGFFKSNLIFSVIGIFIYDKINFKGYRISDIKLDFIDKKLLFEIWQVSFYVLVIVTLMTVIWGYSSVRKADRLSNETLSNNDFQFKIIFNKRIKSYLKEILFSQNSRYTLSKYVQASIDNDKISKGEIPTFIVDTVSSVCDNLSNLFPIYKDSFLKRVIFYLNYKKLTKRDNTVELYRVFKDMYKLMGHIPNENNYNKQIFSCYNMILMTLEHLSKNTDMYKNVISDNEKLYFKRKYTISGLTPPAKPESIILPDTIFYRNTDDIDYWIKINNQIPRILKISKNIYRESDYKNNHQYNDGLGHDKKHTMFYEIFDHELRMFLDATEDYDEIIYSISETKYGINYLKMVLNSDYFELRGLKLNGKQVNTIKKLLLERNQLKSSFNNEQKPTF